MATVLWQQLGLDIDGETAGDQSGFSVSLSVDGTYVAIGAPYNSSTRGQVRVYKYNGTTLLWEQVGGDIDGAPGDKSGTSVSLSANGMTVAIGAPENDSNGTDSGRVRIYNYIGSTWTQVGQNIDGLAANDKSGYSVSLSADAAYVAIGEPFSDGNGTDSGKVRIYKYNGATLLWEQVGGDIDGDANGDQSGTSVSLSADGTYVAIGAPYNSSDRGQVRIYKYNGATLLWEQVGGNIDGEAVNDNSGSSVSLSADGMTVAIGAPLNNDNGIISGQVRIYKYNGSTWTQVGQDIDGEASGDNSGYSVSLSADGTCVAIGAIGNNSGQVRIYKYIGSTWSQVGLNIDGETLGDLSGYSVSLSADGTRVAIGAIGTNSGQVRVFYLLTPSPICYAKGTLVATSRGMVAIEDLLMSDKLRTYDRIEESMFKPVHGVPVKTLTRVEDTRFKNRFARIKFIGKFSVNIMNENTAPIRITAGALGDSKPEKDLLVSPNHSIVVGIRLMFAKNLVNGTTIYQDMSFKHIEYFHVLSDDHYVINANGALSETLGSEEIALFESLHSFPEYIESPKYNFKTVHIKDDVDLIQFDTIPDYSFTEMTF